jgi:hypothetical protein
MKERESKKHKERRREKERREIGKLHQGKSKGL